jgi:hypothetical protein
LGGAIFGAAGFFFAPQVRRHYLNLATYTCDESIRGNITLDGVEFWIVTNVLPFASMKSAEGRRSSVTRVA